MKMHTIGGMGPFRDVLMGEMNAVDPRSIDPRRITEEVINSMYSNPDLDRRYRGRDFLPIIVVVHQRSDYAGFPSASSLARSAEEEYYRQQQRYRQQSLASALDYPRLPSESYPVSKKESPNNLLLLI